MYVVLLLAQLLRPVVLSTEPQHTPWGSKARYRAVAGDITTHEFTCKPVALYSVHRHGTRNIGRKVVGRIELLVKALRAHHKINPSSHLAWIDDFSHSHKKNKDLVLEGYEELYEQGVRFKRAFPSLLSPGTTQVGSSYKGRCISSGLSFLSGALGNSFRLENGSAILESIQDIFSECGERCGVYKPLYNTTQPPLHFNHLDNHLLRYYKDCANYVKKENTKMVWQAGPNEWLSGKQMAGLTKKMSVKLGIELTSYDTVTLHIMCALEVAVPRLMHSSHWCSLFEEGDLYLTAFYLDLLRWAGKMMPEAVNSSCVLLQDGLHFLNTSTGARLKFAHTETIFPLLKKIGYLSQSMRPRSSLRNRQFFGDLTPLGGNFFLVASECEGEEGRYVEAFLNENSIQLPSCPSPCKLETLLKQFPPSSCDFAAICTDTSIGFVSLHGLQLIMVSLVGVGVFEYLRRTVWRH